MGLSWAAQPAGPLGHGRLTRREGSDVAKHRVAAIFAVLSLAVGSTCSPSTSQTAAPDAPTPTAPEAASTAIPDLGVGKTSTTTATPLPALAETSTPSSTTTPTPAEATPTQTPTSPVVVEVHEPLLPAHRIVAFYGVPGSPAMGTLAIGTPAEAVQRLIRQAEPYAEPGRPTLPAFELIATVAQATPGPDGDYSHAVAPEQIWPYLEAIRSVDGILILDFQTGRDSFMAQIPAYAEFLRQPDVHIALDPEWHMGSNEVPAVTIGSVTAIEVAEVQQYLSGIVEQHDLPPKLVIIHQFRFDMIDDRAALQEVDGTQLVLQMDGHGPPSLKSQNYQLLSRSAPIFNGFKLFYNRDVPLMSSTDTLALTPVPDFVSYQ